MLVWSIEYTAGSFHAPPWVRRCGPDEIEWPPSPWRLLEALVTGWRAAGWEDRELFLTILDALADPPLFLLPRSMAAASRHRYGAIAGKALAVGRDDLAVDSYLAVDPDRAPRIRAYALWPAAEFGDEQRALVQRCCRAIAHLSGRDSGCTVFVGESIPFEPGLVRVEPMLPDAHAIGLPRLVAARDVRGFDLLEKLSCSAGALQCRGRSRWSPEGAEQIGYRIESDFLMVPEQYDRIANPSAEMSPMIVRMLVLSSGDSRKPLMRDAILIAELFRAAVMRRWSDREGTPVPLRLAGKDNDGSSRKGHDHPYFLPRSLASGEMIDAIDIWFPRGCSHAEFCALRSVEILREHRRFKGDIPLQFNGKVESPEGVVWKTATPIMLERFPKRKRIDGVQRTLDAPHEQIQQMVRRAVGVAAHVHIFPCNPASVTRERLRKDEGRLLPVYHAEIRFEHHVRGPIVLGAMAHFGLGRLEPIDQTSDVS